MSWLPFYREVMQVLWTYETRQTELLDLLREMRDAGLKPISLKDEIKNKHDEYVESELDEIDPFTFLATFHTGKHTRLKLWELLRTRFNIQENVPDNFAGLPTIVALSAWYLPFKRDRKDDDVATLWRVFHAALKGEISAELFAQALQVGFVAVAKLTIGLFWVNPERYLSLDGTMQQYLAQYEIVPDMKKLRAGDFDEYNRVLEVVHEKLGTDHMKISRDAWESRGKTITPIVITPQKPDETPKEVSVSLPEFPLNQILYGPPGTGKTYSSVARAVEIIDGVVSGTRSEVVARFETLRAENRIGFVTFHQSFAYEEFVEGLRPVLDDDSDGAARYEIRDGVFKQMALRALAASLRFPAPPQNHAPTFEQLWDALILNIDESASYEIAGLGKARFRLSLSPLGTIYGENRNGNAQKPYTASRGKVREVWEKIAPDEKPTHNRIYEILERGAHNNLIGAVIEEMRAIAKSDGFAAISSTRNETRAPNTEDARDFLKGAASCEIDAQNESRFVLIIDEINRGNISKIFGELITLLEDDKRIGAENSLRLELPYSRETFGVPRNLYVLGTMNTADKSLALLDIALRRRFDFEELRPDFSNKVCVHLNDTMRGVLQQLNARLMRVLDREHRLGHAAWRNVSTRESWNEVFLKQIVPLLQEYFYNDWENLRAVLGESGNSRIVRELKSLDGVRSRTRYAWWFDCDENADSPDFLAILAKNFKIETSSNNANSCDETTNFDSAISENQNAQNSSDDETNA